MRLTSNIIFFFLFLLETESFSLLEEGHEFYIKRQFVSLFLFWKNMNFLIAWKLACLKINFFLFSFPSPFSETEIFLLLEDWHNFNEQLTWGFNTATRFTISLLEGLYEFNIQLTWGFKADTRYTISQLEGWYELNKLLTWGFKTDTGFSISMLEVWMSLINY